jgi:hypothetical protein
MLDSIGETRGMAKQPTDKTAKQKEGSTHNDQPLHAPSLRPNREFWQVWEVRYLDHVADTTLTQPCSMNFWTFAVPVMLATAGSHGAGMLAKRLFNGDHESIQETAMFATKFGAFWLIAGFAWIKMCKRNGAKT